MNLNKNEKKILSYIREGRNTLADFTDNLGISAPQANNIAENLENQDFIIKESYTGIKRYNFLLTDKGAKELTQLSEIEKELLTKESINLNQYKILKYTSVNPNAIAGVIAEKLNIPAMELISDLRYLVDKGLMKESGILRRKVSVFPKGVEIVNNYEQMMLQKSQ